MQTNKLLKFITCGSVDDGKSTLIGHLLYDAKLVYTDQEQALVLDSKIGSNGGEIDYSLLLDGLLAEREQGITIDVAYRYFTTDRRSFIVADTPGHEEYTRNMAVGASYADLAVILVDASQGVLVQTKRHTRICAMMGIRHFVFAVNKMDLVSYDEARFALLEAQLQALAAAFMPASVCAIPLSATVGDNITKLSENMPWYQGSTLLSYLENIAIAEDGETKGFVLPIQRVCRPDHTFRGFQGQVAFGSLRLGDTIIALPSGEEAKVTKLFNTDKEVDVILAGQAVTVSLDREIDISRGDVLLKDAAVAKSKFFTGTLLWMDDVPLSCGKNFMLRLGTKQIPCTVASIEYAIDVNSGEHTLVDNLSKNGIAVCTFAAAEPVLLRPFFAADHAHCDRDLGTFLLIDRVSNMTAACGTVLGAKENEHNLTAQALQISKEMRSAALGQKPLTLWFSGLSGAGKSTIAGELERTLHTEGKHTMLLDGDNIRFGLNKDLGFSDADRAENIRRIAEVSKLFNDAGLIVLTAFISPFAADRALAKEIIGEDFVEIYVSTPLETCEERDVKGLYKKARNGEIGAFTGISSPFEAPKNPDITLDTSVLSLEQCVEKILTYLKER